MSNNIPVDLKLPLNNPLFLIYVKLYNNTPLQSESTLWLHHSQFTSRGLARVGATSTRCTWMTCCVIHSRRKGDIGEL